MKAQWNGKIIADSKETITIEGNHYFPSDSVDQSYLIKSNTQSVCPWKGTASYFSISVDGKKNLDAAWSYSEPKEAAQQIKKYIAFWKGVEVIE
jgi:uncharacterized protein (DUF427 family)